GDARSLHFVPFPEARKEYFNPDIERAMARMQAVIEMGRVIRERNNISLKNPLMELVVIHPNAQYLEDVRGLSSYIVEELNLRKLVLTSDETKYGIKYRAQADYKKLGAKLRQDMPRVRKALPEVPSAEIKAIQDGGSLTVDGITLDAEDFNVVRYFDALSLEEKTRKYEEASDKDVVVLLDTEVYEELQQEGVAREIINRVQRLRKKAGLKPVDDIVYYFKVTQDADGALANVFNAQAGFLREKLKQDMFDMSKKTAAALIEEEQEVNESKFLLSFVRHS
ncbi:isoleucine--tRNA ligase, partial [Coemansia sp. RSA 2618]